MKTILALLIPVILFLSPNCFSATDKKESILPSTQLLLMSSPTCAADLDGDDICDNEDPCVGDIGNVDYDGDGILFACDSDFGNTGPVCLAIGQVCTVSDQCCSRWCVDNGLGLTTCHSLDGPPAGCQPMNEICNQDSDCCSGSCVPVGTSGVGRCLDPPGCLDDGEFCGYASSNNCCSGNENCFSRFYIEGFLGGRCSSIVWPICLADGETCAFNAECCNGNCVQNEGTGLRSCMP